uniref:Nuclear factor of kappa light polypeptide gene enhancer in B-cells 2 (p49/p100) n=1 Tax=Myripristis murdjan TaxID=586833 RepID=A0A667Z1I2_9TELE
WFLQERGFRFRYECEGPSHGGLPGASSEKNRRTYPTVKVNNYVGQARVEVQLVTHTDPPRVHAHSLVGRQCTEHGTCTLDVGPNDLTASFSNLGILHVTKKSVVEVLTKRLREERKRQKGPHHHFTDAEESSILKEAKDLGKVMDLNIVRLKFTAYLQDSNGGFTRALKPVVSNPIYDSKSPNASNLKISRLDRTCGSVLGGDEIFLLCDKVQKGESRRAELDFFRCLCLFCTDVCRYAIVFKTPPYHSLEIERPVTVFLQLKRKRAGDSSDPKQFTYVPHQQDREEVQRKKQKPLPHYDPWRGAGGRGGAGGFGGGGGGAGGGGGGGGGGGNTQRWSPAPPPGGAWPKEKIVSFDWLTADMGLWFDVCLSLSHSPLHLAIIHQQAGVIQQLVYTLLSSQQRRVLNATNHLQQTPLHLAVITRQVKVVELLLRAGADPSLLDKDGRTALHLAAQAGDDATLRPLLAHLGERHAHLVNMADYHGLHPLHLAVRRGGERCLRLLVEGGAKINAPEQKSGSSALHLAVRENLFKVACFLITELKADVNMSTFGGNTPLHLAAGLGSPTLCSMLIAAGADKNLENDEPLFLSSSSSSSSDDEQEDEPITEQAKGREAAPPPINPRKRPAAGHTPLDLAKCQKVRNLLDSRQSPASSRPSSSKKTKPSRNSEASGLDGDTLARLVEVLSVSDVPWRKLAEKLGMMTLTHLYQDSPAPCQHLLYNYQLGGGPVEGLVEALQSLGLTEGVRLLRSSTLQDDKQPPRGSTSTETHGAAGLFLPPAGGLSSQLSHRP